MAALLLRLAAPLQAWGSSSKFNIRTTEREPTKSGVIGMIAAALGIKRNDDPEKLVPLSELRFGVRVEREGKLLKDFHMVYTGSLSDKARRHTKSDSKNMHLTERYYLSDAVFLVALESDNKCLLNRIAEALEKPVFPLFLGRRSCPPTLPVVLGMRDDDLLTVLRNEESLTEKNNSSKRIIYEVHNGGSVVKDVPLSFSQMHRQHGYRMKKEEMVLPGEHDPFEEL
ncbi:MAG: type I-E CRISPR-associated protein Cas5/CasD [Oscillospiraceae bacterium]|nr:type I-E CRISPR-associated protein Cas5/CasD [Oscillospiraceae bacterium]